MELSRRTFNRMLMLACAVGSSFFVAGCTVWDDIVQYAPAGIAAVTNLLNLLGSFGIIPVGTGTAAAALISAITLLWNDVVADVKLYKADANASLAQKIEDELQQISTQIMAFLGGLNLGSGTAAKVAQALISLILSTIAGFISSVAAHAGASTAAARALSRRTFAMGGHVIVIEPKYLDRAKFVKQWNSTVDQAGHPEAELK